MKEHGKKLGTTPINKLLLELGIPATIGMIANSLYNLVDTFFVGKGAGIEALGAMAVAWPLQIMVMAVALMLGAGASSVVGRYLGAKEIEKADKVVSTTYIISIIVGVTSTIIGILFLDQLLLMFGATKAMIPLTKEYVGVVLLGNTFMVLSMAMTNIIRSEGRAKETMKIMIIGILTNVILDPIFIFDWGLGLGLGGAALATVIGYFASCLMILNYIRKNETVLKINPFKVGFNKKEAINITKIGFPSFIRNVVGSLVAILLNFSIQWYSANPELFISMYGTVNKVIGFVFMPSMGIVQGFGPIASFNFGSKQYDRVIEVTKTSIKAITLYFAFGTVIMLIIPKTIISLFIQGDIEGADHFINTSATILRYVSFMLPVLGISIVSSQLYQSIGKAKEAMFLSFSRQIFLTTFILVIPLAFGLNGIWFSYPASDLISGIIAYYFIRYEFKLLRNEIKEV